MGSNIFFKSFNNKVRYSRKKKLIKILKKINRQEIPEFIKSYKKNYVYNYKKNIINKYKAINNIKIIGMGGSSLGIKALYNFLISKVKKKVIFFENLSLQSNKTKSLNIIISKSGNTLETISNYSVIKNQRNNLFMCENSNNYIRSLAKKLNCQIINHKNYIGGRYSVLSEVGMLPAIFMGLKPEKFKNFNNLIKNKNFINSLLDSVVSTIYFLSKKKYNSIILNYDELSHDLFAWYQQLVAESLGKNSKGILPMVSSMPKDNHSLMQLYLDGPKNCFFTFFDVNDHSSQKIKNSQLFNSFNYLKNKNLYQIKSAQKKATENVFRIKKIPFRSFKVLLRSEEALGELFTFFMLETILLGDAMKVNPFDQPSVELIKTETKKILTN